MLKCIEDNVLIRPVENNQEETMGALKVISDNKKNDFQKGKIISVNNSYTTKFGSKISSILKEGDEVMYVSHPFILFDEDGGELHLVSQDDVKLIVVKND